MKSGVLTVKCQVYSLSGRIEIFVFGALFGPNEVLEMYLAPFLDKLSVLEQKIAERSLWASFGSVINIVIYFHFDPDHSSG